MMELSKCCKPVIAKPHPNSSANADLTKKQNKITKSKCKSGETLKSVADGADAPAKLTESVHKFGSDTSFLE